MHSLLRSPADFLRSPAAPTCSRDPPGLQLHGAPVLRPTASLLFDSPPRSRLPRYSSTVRGCSHPTVFHGPTVPRLPDGDVTRSPAILCRFLIPSNKVPIKVAFKAFSLATPFVFCGHNRIMVSHMLYPFFFSLSHGFRAAQTTDRHGSVLAGPSRLGIRGPDPLGAVDQTQQRIVIGIRLGNQRNGRSSDLDHVDIRSSCHPIRPGDGADRSGDPPAPCPGW